MAWSRITTGGGNFVTNGTSISQSITPSALGDLLLLSVASNATPTITDNANANQVWQVANPWNSTYATFYCFANTTNAFQVSAQSNTSAGYMEIIADCFTGGGGSTAKLDQIAFGSGTGTAGSAGPVTLTADNELLWAYGTFLGSYYATAGNGYTISAKPTGTGDISEYQILTGGNGSSQAATFSIPYSAPWTVQMATFAPGSGGHMYTQGFSASFTPWSGTVGKSTSHALAQSLPTLSGKLIRANSHGLSGTLSTMVGSLVRQTSHGLSASSSQMTGKLGRANPVTLFARFTSRKQTSGLGQPLSRLALPLGEPTTNQAVWNAAVTKQQAKGGTFAAVLAPFSASVVKAISHAFTASAQTMTGSLQRGHTQVLTLTATWGAWMGALNLRSGRSFSAAWGAWQGSVTSIRAKGQALLASLAPLSGTVGQTITHGQQLQATLANFSASLPRALSHSFSAVLANFSASLTRPHATAQAFAAQLRTMSGSVVRNTSHTLSALTQTMSAGVSRVLTRSLTAQNSAWSATLSTIYRMGGPKLQGFFASLGFTAPSLPLSTVGQPYSRLGQPKPQSQKAWSAALSTGLTHGKVFTASLASFSASMGKQTSHTIAAVLSPFTAVLGRINPKALSASFGNWSGSVSKQLSRSLNAVLPVFSPALSLGHSVQQALTATLTLFSATLSRGTQKTVSATWQPWQAFLTKARTLTVPASLSVMTGKLGRFMARTISASTTAFAATLTQGIVHVLNLTASLSTMTGQLTHSSVRVFTATLATMAGKTNQAITKGLSTVWTPFAATFTKNTTRFLNASLSDWTASVSALHHFGSAVQALFTASLAPFSGSLAKGITTNLPTSWTPWVTQLQRSVNTSLAATMTLLSGQLAKGSRQVFSALTNGFNVAVSKQLFLHEIFAAQLSLFAATLTKQTSHALGAITNGFSGILSRTFARTLNASLALWSATQIRTISKTMTGAWGNWAGALSLPHLRMQVFLSQLNQFNAVVRPQANKTFTAQTAFFSAKLGRSVSKLLQQALNFTVQFFSHLIQVTSPGTVTLSVLGPTTALTVAGPQVVLSVIPLPYSDASE